MTTTSTLRRLVPVALVLLVTLPRSRAQETIGPETPLSADAVAALEDFIGRELESNAIPALSIALVDRDRIVWARGFGLADPLRSAPATAETVYRVGSVSKLFTDLAAMQLVESGALDLDAPVADYLPDFHPANPFGEPVTLRMLMSHRSGLVREPPVGHYFDPTGPTIAETVLSLNDAFLVYPPGDRTKYSNAGVTVVGRVVERVAGTPFAAHVRSKLLEPLGMTSSDFERTPAIDAKAAHALLWTYDGREFPAPTFPLGTIPAGNLYASAPDLGRFLIALFAEGQGPGGRIIDADTLERMWEPQFDDDGRFGLGFALSEWEGHRRVSHGGAAYGYSTELAALPDERVGVAVCSARDVTNAVTKRIADAALSTLLALRDGGDPPTLESTSPLPDCLARSLRGRYADDEGRVAELIERAGRLSWLGPDGGFLLELHLPPDGDGDRLIVDGPLVADGPALTIDGDAVTFRDTTYRRLPDEPPADCPDRWRDLIGEYGWDHNTLFILEREGDLYALIEWVFFDRLTEVAPDVYAFPTRGLYEAERIVFDRDESGRVTRAVAAGVSFQRRPIGGEDGSTFRIDPLRPVAELRPEALAASPPAEPGPFRDADLVDLTTFDDAIKLDVRYASDNNFLGTPFYSSARAFMQRPAAEALAEANEDLKAYGYGLLIHDAYRPWYVTKMFWDATPEPSRGFVADPSAGSRHNRGCAVDLTLYDLKTGEPVPMVAGYDEFSDRAGPWYPGGTSRRRWHRDLLRRVMEAHGFTVYDLEWWHFDFEDWQSYAIGNVPFEEIEAGGS